MEAARQQGSCTTRFESGIMDSYASPATTDNVRRSGVLQTAATADMSAHSIDRAELQTDLAVDRTILAIERTYDSWVRTGLAALASGIGARALLASVVPDVLTKSTGALLILFAAFCFAAGAWREISFGGRLPPSQIRHLPPVLMVVVNGFLTVVALAAAVGVVIGT